ncbi:unnamed protein product [Closterium sp. NIES-53]
MNSWTVRIGDVTSCIAFRPGLSQSLSSLDIPLPSCFISLLSVLVWSPGKVWAGHNISRFDNARIREAFSALARAPPVPAGVVDTYDLLRREFGTRAGNMKVRVGLVRAANGGRRACLMAPPVPAGVVNTYDVLTREFGTRACDMKVGPAPSTPPRSKTPDAAAAAVKAAASSAAHAVAAASSAAHAVAAASSAAHAVAAATPATQKTAAVKAAAENVSPAVPSPAGAASAATSAATSEATLKAAAATAAAAAGSSSPSAPSPAVSAAASSAVLVSATSALLSQALESLKIDSAATCQNLAAGASHANSKAGDAEGELEDGEVVGEEEEEEEGEEEWEDCDNEQARSYGKEKHSESIPLGTGESREGGEAQGEAGRKEQVGESQACEGECMVCPGWWQQHHKQLVKDGASWPIACAHFDPFWLQAVVAPPAAGAGNGGNDSSRGSGWGGGRRYSLRGGSARVYPNGFTPQAPSGAADIAPAGGGFAVESAPARVLLLYNGRSLHVRECGARIKMSVSDRFAFDESTGRPSFSLLLAISPASAAAIAACFDALLACVGSGEGAAARGEEGRVEGTGEEERDGGCREEVRSPFVASWEEDGMRVIRIKRGEGKGSGPEGCSGVGWGWYLSSPFDTPPSQPPVDSHLPPPTLSSTPSPAHTPLTSSRCSPSPPPFLSPVRPHPWLPLARLAADGVRGNAEWRTKYFSCAAPHTTAPNTAIASTSSPTGTTTTNSSSQQSLPALQNLHLPADPHQLHLPVDPHIVAAALPAGSTVDVAFLCLPTLSLLSHDPHCMAFHFPPAVATVGMACPVDAHCV